MGVVGTGASEPGQEKRGKKQSKMGGKTWPYILVIIAKERDLEGEKVNGYVKNRTLQVGKWLK